MKLDNREPVDIIVPVYRGLAETRRCLESVLGHPQQSRYELVVIDDASPEPELAAWLDSLAADRRITLLRHVANAGFVTAANHGLALHPDRDVVLLNSDTEVNGDWLDRLVRCACADERIGTVTPFSNNATICSYPRFGQDNPLPDGLSLAELDALFCRANAGRWLEIPTAVGFCMYMRRSCLAAVGELDERHFGWGYGEENDFCMRASKAGWRHVLCADTFVYHVGGVSFSDRAAQLQAQAQLTLATLHPEYPTQIQEFIRQDPAALLRLAVNQERGRFSSEQAAQVILEQNAALSDLWRQQQQCLSNATALEQGLHYAESLINQAWQELERRDQALSDAQYHVRQWEIKMQKTSQALTEAQGYVRQREADVVALQEQARQREADVAALQEQARQREIDIAILKEQRRMTREELRRIHAAQNRALPSVLSTIMTKTTHLFTSITANYLPKARVLADSARRQGLDIQFHVLLCDDYPADAERSAEPFDSIIDVQELPVPGLESWLFGHTVVEMCTAVKAMGFLEIARRFAADKIFYFDPDIAILSGLDGLIERLDRHSILLTPHQTLPEQALDAVIDNEIGSLKYGVFNLGFLGVRTSEEGLRFLNWWADRLRHFCHDDIAGGLFTDQRWIDLAPAFFPDIGILREPSYNVATWNLTHRRATGSLAEGIAINGEPLAFYHFSGFDGGAQEIMLKKYAAKDSVLFDLRRWYIEECERMGQAQLGNRPSRYHHFDNGQIITRAHRILYRTRLDLQRAFPQPFQTTGKSYYQWFQLNNPAGGDADDTATDEAIVRAQLSDARRELDLIKRSRSWRLARAMTRVFNVFR